MKIRLFVFLVCLSHLAQGQTFLPPVLPWHGKSEALIAKKDDPWITPAEKLDFRVTPSIAETTEYLKRLCKLDSTLVMYEHWLFEGEQGIPIICTDKNFNIYGRLAETDHRKPVLFVQAGIHSGEIDGKDAVLMLLRDIALGKKKELLKKVDLIFVPVLNIYGHEQASKFNRPNQRGPENMGLRTNSENLNLNRDYMKLESGMIRRIVGLLKKNPPDLYMDIHVTDGADYQYDITYGFVRNGHSPKIGNWLDSVFTPYVNRDLEKMGHIPGPFLNTTNNRDFSEGNSEYYYGPNFSHGYGDLIHVPTVLVENHSLKPYKQRVLGTYVLIESAMKLLAEQYSGLQACIKADAARRDSVVPYAWRFPKKDKLDSLLLKGIKSRIKKSPVTGGEYVEWLGIKEQKRVAFYKEDEPYRFIRRPKGYWVPKAFEDMYLKLYSHGLLKPFRIPVETEITQYKMSEPVFASQPFEGKIRVTAKAEKVRRKVNLKEDYVYVSTDQPLGDLAILLLEPDVPESLFQWGYFNSIFQRTEYAEDYFLEPMAEQMLKDSPELRARFEQKKKDEPAFAQNPKAILEWFYAQSPYYDQRYLWYPVLRDE